MGPGLRYGAPRVAILGGINLDTFLRVHSLPVPGETTMSSEVLQLLGGKAANQAIAVARAGVPVTLLAAVGGDSHGERLRETLTRTGVDTLSMLRLEHAATGRATILVDDHGENVIVVTAGANGQLSAQDMAAFEPQIAEAAVLVVQNEIQPAATIEAIALAERAGVRCIVNLAPFEDLGEAVSVADPLVVNEIEASQLLGYSVDAASIREAATGLMARARSVVVTLGAYGAFVVNRSGAFTHVSAPAASAVVDTTGAGDAFVGVLAGGIARGLSLEVAVARAVDAATASVAVLGAGEKYPQFDLGLSEAATS